MKLIYVFLFFIISIHAMELGSSKCPGCNKNIAWNEQKQSVYDLAKGPYVFCDEECFDRYCSNLNNSDESACGRCEKLRNCPETGEGLHTISAPEGGKFFFYCDPSCPNIIRFPPHVINLILGKNK